MKNWYLFVKWPNLLGHPVLEVGSHVKSEYIDHYKKIVLSLWSDIIFTLKENVLSAFICILRMHSVSKVNFWFKNSIC